MSEPLLSESHACPRCGAANERGTLAEHSYQCSGCGLELAHLDVAPNGTVRAVLGWLRAPRETLQDRYLIRAILGRGGFAATYLVEDLRLKGKRRALKEIPLVLYDEAETALLSRLQHPAIPDIVDRFEADQMTYLVLEFGGQRSLEDERRRQGGTIPAERLLPWIRQLSDVLSYLHGQKPPIVHRDLKPENILLDERDQIMLIDFGIAKESGEMGVTRTIARSVSHGFSPPEQALGTGTDERSDVYALGATMYALSTGKAPPAAHQRVAGQDLVPPRSLSPSVPAALDAAIVQALSLNMNHRQQSIREFARMCEPGAGATVPQGRDMPGARTERLPTHAPAERRAPATAPSRAPIAIRRGDSRRLVYLLAPILLLGTGALWFVLARRSAEPSAPAATASTSPAEAPALPNGGAAPAAGESAAVAPPPAAAVEAAPAVVQPRLPPSESGSATRALEQALASRKGMPQTGGPSSVAAPIEKQPSAPNAPVASVAERVRAALKARGLGEVTVQVVAPNRVRLGNLASESAAARARETAASVVDPGTTIEAPVAQARVDRPKASVPKPAEPTSDTPGWGPIRREGANRIE